MPALRERSLRQSGAELVLASFVVLFLELTLIRWISGEIRVLAYFPNVILISAFLGLGIGSMRAGRRSLLWLWPAGIVAATAATLVMSGIAFTSRSTSEHLWLLYYDIPNAPVVHDVRPPIAIVFVLTAIPFLALGQIVGERLNDFARAGHALRGYAADLSGSLLGVIGFALVSFFRTFPVTWFAIALIPGMWLIGSRGWRSLLAYACIVGALISTVGLREKAMVYSPYYALRARHTSRGRGIEILANGSLHQYAAPLGAADRATSLYDTAARAGYPIPYRLMRTPPRRVLVLGAGTGNDVVEALQQGALQVDAVEIDPLIIAMGRSLHPDRPYASPRVRVINDDARAFLRNTSAHYDLIVFGTLDSMTRLSALSNVRLDNFVYTVDCMRAARQHLTPNGGVALYFMVGSEAIHDKLFAMLTEAFGTPPFVIRGDFQLFNEILLAGPAWNALQTPAQRAIQKAAIRAAAATDVPTDDWPYLYLNGRTISRFYASMVAFFLLVAVAMMAAGVPEMRSRPWLHFDLEMFLFGAAFLLLETKLVTQMSLVWGATWLTSAVVFASILLMILVATLIMDRRPIPYAAAAAALVITLLVVYALPVTSLLQDRIALRLATSVLYAGVPVFFAAICFALRFGARRNSSIAFGWNLAGAVVGGLIEILAIVIGLRALTLVVLIAYLGAFLAERREQSREAALAKAC